MKHPFFSIKLRSNTSDHRRFVHGLVATLLAFSTNVIAGSGSFVASENHGLLLNSDGSVCAVGQNEFGELGDGTSVNQFTLEKLSEFSGAGYLSAGWYHTVALKTDGTVWAWGYNADGALGDNTTVSKPTPNQVLNLTGVIAVAAGKGHSLAAKSDGTVWGWGLNISGQVGDGTTTRRFTPVQTIIISSVTAVAAGDAHSLALKSDGTVWAWGNNAYGQIGDGTTTQRNSPVQVASLSGVIAIAAGNGYSLALKSDGTVWGWGYNGNGELGDGSNTNRPNIVRSGTLSGVTAFAAGDGHSLAVKSDGTVWAWGNNAHGELGDNTTNSRNAPVQAIGLTAGVRVAAGVAHSTALRSDGSVWAWGDNTYGQLGTANTVSSLNPVASLQCTSIPPASGLGYSADRLKASEKHSMAVRNDGTVWSWGENANGELGDGTTIDRSSPVQASSLTGVTRIAAGWYHTLAAKSDGTVWAWGSNFQGELGDNTQVSKPAPNHVPNFVGAIAVAAGQYHSLAAKTDGTVWAWGWNPEGQLGDGTQTERLIPVQTLTVTGVIAVAAGDKHSLALKSDGTVWAWGYNAYGQLGDGTFAQRTSPVQVANLSGVIAIAAGADYSLALKSDGTVWGWGDNGLGQLGDGSTTNRNEIVRTSGLTNVVAIAAGDGHSLAVKSDGTVWAWGYNGDGELGDGTLTLQTQPVQSVGLSDMVAVAAGSTHSLALKSDGTIWAWGLNDLGQFGEPQPASSTVPVSAVPAGIGGVATLTLSIAEPGAGSLVASPPSPNNTYPTGTTVCLTAIPNSGWVFSGFTGDALDSSHCIFLDANHSVTANFLSSVALRFVPVTPCRIADTRGNGFTGPFGPPSLSVGIVRDFPIASSCGIPGTAQAYSMNIGVVPTGRGYLTVWPSQQPQPLVTTLNTDGRVKSAGAIIPAGSNGAISVYANVKTDVVLDINGYFVSATVQPAALAFYPLTPCRVADTRNAVGPLGGPFLAGNTSRTFPVRAATSCNISSTAQAYSLNLAVVPRVGRLSYLTAWATGQAQPLVASLNDPVGVTLSNAAIVPADSSGQINIYATQDTDVVMDINGYFAPPGTGGMSLYNLEPCRALDSRNPPGSLPFTGTILVNVFGSGCGAPSAAKAYIFNGTVVPQNSHGYLTLWQHGQTQPLAASLNASDGTVTGNTAIVPTSDGSINAYFSGTTFLILDIFGYFAP